MKKAIIIHGYFIREKILDPEKPTPSNHQWIPWLSKQLYVRDIFPIAIEMPTPWRPNYDAWKKELERFELDQNTILVGHSYGGGFLVRYLSESNVKVGKVFLVAPYLGFSGGDVKDDDPTFFQFNIDEDLATNTSGVTIFESTNDKTSIRDSIEYLRKSIRDLNVITVKNAGHFCIRDGYREFPELLTELTK